MMLNICCRASVLASSLKVLICSSVVLIFSFNTLWFVRYLTSQVNPTTQTHQVSIPNKELKDHWKTEFIPIAKSFMTDLSSLLKERIRNCLIEFNTTDLEVLMKDMLLHCSFHDVASTNSKSENSYHMFFYGCFFAVLHDSNNIIVSSNKEAGHGRYDIRIGFRDVKKAVVFEFKKSKTRDKLEDDAKNGLNQCMNNQYLADLPDYNCLLIGVSFIKKEMSKLYIHVQ